MGEFLENLSQKGSFLNPGQARETVVGKQFVPTADTLPWGHTPLLFSTQGPQCGHTPLLYSGDTHLFYSLLWGTSTILYSWTPLLFSALLPTSSLLFFALFHSALGTTVTRDQS